MIYAANFNIGLSFFKKYKEEDSTPRLSAFRSKAGISYYEEGVGEPLVLLYGLFGSVNNFKYVIDHFKKNYRVIVPQLPVYDLGLKVSVSALEDHVYQLTEKLQLKNVHLIGNSLGGHIALLYTLRHPENVKSLVLVGSSGLFENGMGDTYPKRGDYNYIKAKAEKTFFKAETATKELVDEIFETVNNRIKALQILALAKSTIKYNLKEDLNKIKCRSCIIWGKEDEVTPIAVAHEFKRLIPHAGLHVIDNCGHVPMLETPEEFNSILSSFFTNSSYE